jgi:hypothetical protein
MWSSEDFGRDDASILERILERSLVRIRDWLLAEISNEPRIRQIHMFRCLDYDWALNTQ